MFIDRSVNTGDIDESLDDEAIRIKIRDQYLRDSTVTIVLVGAGTRGRKHVDWEIYSSMINGTRNKKSGVVAVLLPNVATGSVIATSRAETELYPDIGYGGWSAITTFNDAKQRYPYLPDRILDNVIAPDYNVSVTEWSRITENPSILGALIDYAHLRRATTNYNLSRLMRRNNS